MNAPIGFFDSGVGGTSIWQEIRKRLPNENTLYLADSQNAPYGNKSKSEILELSLKNTELLLENDCKLIIVACNTATTNAIAVLRKTFSVPFIGIEPAIKPAALKTKTKKVGVLATQGTLSSELFQNTAKLHASGISIFEKYGDGLVPLIEAGKAHSDETRLLLQKHLKPMLADGIDTLVLGCTHYPYLRPLLEELLPNETLVIDSGFAVAKQTEVVLRSHGLLSTEEAVMHQFYTNGNTQILKDLVTEKHVFIKYLDF